MPRQKKLSAKTKKKFTDQARDDLRNVLKTAKTLETELKVLKRDVEHMIPHRHNNPPTYSGGPGCK